MFLKGIGDSRRMSIRLMQYDGTRNISAMSSPSLKMSLTRFLLTSPVVDSDKCPHAEYALPSKLQANILGHYQKNVCCEATCGHCSRRHIKASAGNHASKDKKHPCCR